MAEVSIAADIGALAYGTATRNAFELDFKQDVAVLMSTENRTIRPSDVEIIDLRAGSVIVSFYVHATTAAVANVRCFHI